MEARLISLPLVQLARLLGLVRSIEPVELQDSRDWGLLIRGRGFTRLLEQELLHAPNLIRPVGWSTPRPITFRGRQAAVTYAQRLGLLPRQKTWSVSASE
ncbi:hypothetical protein ARC20_06540 [Stenotrophomonas panacihumi]|uniref:Uncharacterized protein n=1 Tax=Stenotrophomonas panacihumi TaxID=676599 RepID=A0A0R0ALS9_9GAMM|nr:hypothetical protein [Stenotrophomonas panacihumi]KRG46053.1 hypothetical protein ARC20_06540 [Stenotrophomonas panacihumi]PTN56420.1 hypothetical protein C9J98_01535 [Stenotrophomonas panacihumi]